MCKGKPSKVIVYVGDEDFNFDPRSKRSIMKTKKLNIEWNNKYNASKLTYLVMYKVDSLICICIIKIQTLLVTLMFSDLKFRI